MADHPQDVIPMVATGQPAKPTTQPVTQQTAPTPTPNNPTPANTLEVKQNAETFEALTKLFGDEPTPPPPATPVAPVVGQTNEPATTPAAKPPEGTPVGTELEKKIDGVNVPPGSHPNVASGIATLKELARAEAKRAEELQAKVKEYETKFTEVEKQAKEGKLPDQVEKELTELRQMRRELDLRNDPAFHKSYVEPVQKAEVEIMGLLKQAGLKDDSIKWINENGGVIALSQSSDKANVKDNPDMTIAEWLEDKIIGKTPAVFRNRIVQKLSAAADTIEKGRSELADFHENGQARYDAKMKKLTDDFNAGADTARAALGDLAKVKDIPASATAEERQALEAHNALVKEGEAQFGKYLKIANDPKVSGEMMVKATQADMLLKMHEADQKTIQELNARIDRMKASGSHSAAGDNAPPPGQQTPQMGDLLKQDTATAMEGHFRTAGVTR